MQDFEQQTQLFIERAQLANPQTIQQAFSQFFETATEHKHVILKRSILYFYSGHEIVNTLPCKQLEDDPNIYSFDGIKISRVKPQFFMGKAAEAAAMGREVSIGIGIDLSSNNNNNNNNNNGNNNG